MGSNSSKIVSWFASNPILAFVLVIGGVIVIMIAGFIIYTSLQRKRKKKKYDDLFDRADETDYEEDSNIINKNRGKTKTNL